MNRWILVTLFLAIIGIAGVYYHRLFEPSEIQEVMVEGWSTNPGLSTTLLDVTFLDDMIGWAVATNGAILKSINGGQSWSSQDSGTTNTLHSIDLINASSGWIVGDKGTALKTSDGGNTWDFIPLGTSSSLRDVTFIDEKAGWIVDFKDV